MAKKKKRRRANKFTLPITIVAPMAAVGVDVVKYSNDRGLSSGMYRLTEIMTGYNPNNKSDPWDISRMKSGLFPILAGMVVHKIAGRLGVNRALGKAGVPYLRV